MDWTQLPQWFVMLYILLTIVMKAITNKDLLDILKKNNNNEAKTEMKAEAEMLIMTVKGLQDIIIDLKKDMKTGVDEKAELYYDFFAENFYFCFKKELYIKIIQYLNDVAIWDITDILKIINDLNLCADAVYEEAKQYLIKNNLYVQRFSCFNKKDIIDKIIDILKENGNTSIRMKKKFIYEILLG